MHPVPNMLPHPIVPSQKDDVIMCLCKNNVEEGEMVMCEECDTWQHIICYYPNKLVPAVHFCEDCGSKYHEVKQAAKRQKLMATGDSQSTAANPNSVATLGEPEPSSDDEPLISLLSKTSSNDVARDIKPEPDVTLLTGGRQQAMSVGREISSKTAFMDLTDERDVDAVKIKAEAGDKHSCGNARTLPSQFNPPNCLTTPTAKLAMTPQPTRSARSPRSGTGGTQLINDATTLVFLDGQNRELRRRTFEDLGGRLNVDTLFAQAIRADLIDKFDESAILSVSIRGISDEFKISKYDKPDFARFRERVEDVGLCMVEVRRD